MRPDLLRKSRSIDEFLWNGERKATPVQRAGLVLYSLMFLFVVFLSIAVWIKNDYWIIRAFAVFMGVVGGVFSVRCARNILRH
jgi:magnesium-transporting ATPase (P-type)